ncbi:MAG TPA: pitrilysin family protein, partial [Terrimicrobiaceae bacterium]
MKSLFALVVLFMMLAHAPAKDSSPVVPHLPERPAQVFTLENGLTLIVEEDHSAPVASVQAWCATGSIDEGKWMGAGLSHILEHMLFKGTEERKAGDIARQIQDRGGYINAYTSFDRTVFWIDVPADGTSEALATLCDAMMNSTLPEDEYVKEQEVIRREFAMGFDDPGRQSSQLMLRTVFSESPFRHPIIGYLDIYNRLKRDDVMAYYKARYVPNNLTLVIAGDVETKKVKEQVEEAFKNYPRQPVEPLYIASEPEQIGQRESHEEFATELTRLSLAWRIPALTHPDTPALELLGDVLGSGRSSILNQELREKQHLVHAIDAGMFSLQSDGVFVVQALCDPAQRDAVQKETLAAIERIKESGATQAELDKARRSMLASQLSGLSTARGKASDLGSNWLLTKNINFSKDYLDAIARVTTADLKRVAQKYLPADKLNTTSLNPPGTLVGKNGTGQETLGSPVKKFVLSNGLRLLVREDSRLPLVSIYAAFRGGLLAEKAENNGITRLLSRTVLKGTTSRTSAEIAEQIESVGGRLSSDNGNNTFSVSVDVMKPDLTVGLNVLADILQNPVFPEKEVELEKAAQIAGLKAEEEQITAVARNVLRENLFRNHPYAFRANGRVASVEKISPADLIAFKNDYIAAKNGVVAVFGDVKAEEVLQLVEKEFG